MFVEFCCFSEVSMNDELDDYNDTLNEENGNFDENDLEIAGTQKVRKLETTVGRNGTISESIRTSISMGLTTIR